MRMAVTATPSLLTNMYGGELAAASFQEPSCCFSGLPMNDSQSSSLGSALTMGGTSSFYNSYSDSSAHFGASSCPWDNLNITTPSSIFTESPSLSFSDSSTVYSTDESTDFPLMSSETEAFLIGCSPFSTMHPNLVSNLKNMLAPGPAGSAMISHAVEMYNSAQAMSLLDNFPALTHLEQDRSHLSDSIDILRSAFLRHCQQSAVVPKVELQDSTSTVGAVPPRHSPADEEPPKAVSEKSSETTDEDNIEATVVSVDLIKNKRPFKCQHDGCNKTFKNPQTMKMHHKTHYSDGSAASKECMLASSLKAGHNKKIPSRCPKCKETFVGLYELRRHYGRKHSEGEKPFGCRKCEKKFYIEVDVRDHEKLCGEPIECKCGLKFAFKCNLVAHKKAHPACQEHQTSNLNSGNNSQSSDDSEQINLGACSRPAQQRAGSKRARDHQDSTISPQSGLPIPLPDFKGVPEAPPEFKLARHGHDSFAGSSQWSFPSDISTTSWASNRVYPTIPTMSFANLPVYTKPSSFQSDRLQFHHQVPHFLQQHSLIPSLEAVNCVMGTAFNQLPFKARSG